MKVCKMFLSPCELQVDFTLSTAKKYSNEHINLTMNLHVFVELQTTGGAQLCFKVRIALIC